jgi:hypothetical protein
VPPDSLRHHVENTMRAVIFGNLHGRATSSILFLIHAAPLITSWERQTLRAPGFVEVIVLGRRER